MKQFGKRTVRIIDAVLIGMIVFCVGCGAIRGNEGEVSGETSIANAGAEPPKIGSETISLTEESGISEETETTEAEQRVIALSKSNAELWLLAGGTLVATSDDAMKLDGVTEVVFDFSGLEYISSAGLRVLMTAHKAMAASGGSMKILHPNAMVRGVFEITGLDSVFAVEA